MSPGLRSHGDGLRLHGDGFSRIGNLKTLTSKCREPQKVACQWQQEGDSECDALLLLEQAAAQLAELSVQRWGQSSPRQALPDHRNPEPKIGNFREARPPTEPENSSKHPSPPQTLPDQLHLNPEPKISNFREVRPFWPPTDPQSSPSQEKTHPPRPPSPPSEELAEEQKRIDELLKGADMLLGDGLPAFVVDLGPGQCTKTRIKQKCKETTPSPTRKSSKSPSPPSKEKPEPSHIRKSTKSPSPPSDEKIKPSRKKQEMMAARRATLPGLRKVPSFPSLVP